MSQLRRWGSAEKRLSFISVLLFSLIFAQPAQSADGVMDLSVFNKNDPTVKMTINPACVSFSNIETRSTNSFLYKAISSVGDFIYEFDTILTSADTFAGELPVWGVTNSPALTYNNWTDGFVMSWYKSGTTVNLKLQKLNLLSSVISPNLNLNQRYYLRVKRVGTTLSAEIYSNAARSVRVATLTRTGVSAGSFNYQYALSTENGTTANRKATGDACNFKLTAPAADTQAPTAPGAVNFSNAAETSLKLNWSASTDNVGVVDYRIDVATDNQFSNILTAYANKSVGNVLSFSVTGLNAGKTYYARVRAVDAAGNISTSSSVSGQTSDTAKPSTPANVTIDNVSYDQFKLNWNASTDNATVTGYRIDVATNLTFSSTTMVPGFENRDVGNNLSAVIFGLNPLIKYYARVRAYDAAGNVSFNSSSVNATTIAMPTSEDNRLYVKKILYNAIGQKTKIEYGNGVITTNTYDSLNMRLNRIYTVNAQNEVLQDLSYTYDSLGNILNINDAVYSATQSFKYDALNRLIEANGSRYGLKQYQYDPIGNIVQKDGKIYSYAEAGAGIHAVTSLSDGTTMTYDANGNMASKQKGSNLMLFIYDAENRLIEVKKNGVTTAKYEYDGDGGRVKKIVGSTVTKYVGALYEETNGVKTRHVFVGDLKIASVTNLRPMYFHGDHLGGANVVTDKDGIKKEVTEYEPYGGFSRRDRYGAGAEVASFYFTGQRFDEESGLYYYNARYYMPEIGRFITADKIIPSATDAQSYNRYSYTRNNPVNFIDPSGHFFHFLIDFILMAVASYGIDKTIQGAATGDWSGFSGPKLKNFAIENLSIGILSFGSPIAATSSFVTNRVFETRPGKEVQRWVGKEIFDDAFGMSPRTAHIAANVSLQVAGSLTIEKILANDMGSPVKTKNNLSDDEIAQVSKGEYAADENIFGPSLKSKNARFDEIKGLYRNNQILGSFQKRTLDVPLLKQLGAQHSSVNMSKISSNLKINSWEYATFGVCHQATNATLLNGNVSSTILNIDPSWDMFVTTAVYGNYGGQLGYRIYTGVNSYNKE